MALFDPDQPDAAADSGRRRRRERDGSARHAHAAASEVLSAPMQGTIVKTEVTEGDTVVAGDVVVVLEAMKMENHVSAHRDGVVRTLHVAAGQVVIAGEPLAVIASDDEEPASD